MTRPPFPGPRAALFLDFDGTLAELAPQPDAVAVPADLPPLLGRLAGALGGALAVLSGRPVAEIDHQLQPLKLPVAGVHGVERRSADGRVQRLAVDGLPPLAAALQALVQAHEGLRLELKPGAIALHYRQAPDLEGLCRQAMARALASADGLVLLDGKRVLELMPQQASKGQALRLFLDEPPFLQRRPWFFGDDVTDESGFEAVQSLGGVAVKIGSGDSLARHRLADPQALRDWLAQALQRLESGPGGPRAASA